MKGAVVNIRIVNVDFRHVITNCIQHAKSSGLQKKIVKVKIDHI